jgi:hypothetical protein
VARDRLAQKETEKVWERFKRFMRDHQRELALGVVTACVITIVALLVPEPVVTKIVRLLNRLPTLDLGGGDYSSCPRAAIGISVSRCSPTLLPHFSESKSFLPLPGAPVKLFWPFAGLDKPAQEFTAWAGETDVDRPRKSQFLLRC